jgi:choline dehydrogenase-like flavoprotein
LDNLDESHADVLIVGGGPAGGVTGLRFANASLSVVALEQGDWQDPLRYPRFGNADYLHPRVRARISYEGQVARPQMPDRYPVYIEEGLLDHVLSEHWYESWGRPKSTLESGVT